MTRLHFLLLEDSALDAELVQATLLGGGVESELTLVTTRAEFLSALEMDSFDLILSDYSLPDFDGISALELALRICPEIPFIFVSATLGEELAIEALKNGATDYVLKQRLWRLVPSVQRALREARERRHRRQAETDRDRFFTGLEQNNLTLQTLVESCPLSVVFLDMKGTVKLWNRAAEIIFGWSADEAVGQFLPSAIDHRAAFLANLQAVLQGQSLMSLEVQRTRKDGQTVDLEIWATLIFDAEGNPGCLSISADIGDRKRAERSLQKQNEQLRLLSEQLTQANRIKDEFLAVLSHELRTPLNPILGWARILRTKQCDQLTTARALEIIERNAKIQTQLIEDLLDISRILQGKLSLKIDSVDLRPVVEAALETVHLAAEAKSIAVQFCLEGERSDRPEFLVLGDPNRLQQIVWNLLSNAVKFTPIGGSIAVCLSMRDLSAEEPSVEELHQVSDTATRQVQLRVSDTGQGISSDFLPYLFDYFRQADSSATRTFGGLGLGLTIVHHLVQLHGGTVQADSAGEEQGATFTIRLPWHEAVQKLAEPPL